MRVRVGVRDKQLDIQLGEGTQTLLWLANAALCRYDSSMGLELGPPLGLRLEDGTQLPMHCAIADYLVDGGMCFVVIGREEEIEEDPRAGDDGEEENEGGADADGGDDE
jgi:hypothetical protein